MTDVLREIAEATKWANGHNNLPLEIYVMVVELHSDVVVGFTTTPQSDARVLFKRRNDSRPWVHVRVQLRPDEVLPGLSWVIAQASMPVRLLRSLGSIQLFSHSLLIFADDSETSNELRQQNVQRVKDFQTECRISVLLEITRLHAHRLIKRLKFKDESFRLATTAKRLLATRNGDRFDAAITLKSISHLNKQQLKGLLEDLEYQGEKYMAWIVEDYQQWDWVALLNDIALFIRR